MKNLIVGIGEILWDVFPDRKVLGGAPANFAYHAGQFGYDSLAISAIGDDEAGKEILDTLTDKGLNHFLQITPYPTGTVQVTLDEKGVTQYEIVEGVAWDYIPFTSRTEEIARNTRAVCFGSLAQRNSVSQATIQRFLETMPAGSLKIFDINLRQHFYSKELIESSLSVSNILKINDDELDVLSGMFAIKGAPEQVSRWFIERYGLQVLILTRGATDSYVFTPEGESHLPTPCVKVADTVGAGDAFTGAFTVAYLAGKPIEKAHALAVEVSAFVCTQHGAMPQLSDSGLKL